LKEVGLDLSFVLDKLFFADISHAVDENAGVLNESIIKIFDNERFRPTTPPADCLEIWNKDFGSVKVQCSNGIYLFYKLIHDFGSNMDLVISIPLFKRIVSGLRSFFSTLLNKHLEVIEGVWETRQYSTMLVNANLVIDVIMPRVSVELSSIKFEMRIPELEEHRIRLKSIIFTRSNS
jgi:hypothetical protein